MRVSAFEGGADGQTVAVLLHDPLVGWRLRLLSGACGMVAGRDLPFADAGGLRLRPRSRQVSLFGDGDVYLWDPDQDALRCLTEGRFGVATFHSWAPDGRRLCFMAFDPHSGAPPALYLWDSGGTSDLPHDGAWPDFRPEWSPDGALVAFRRGTLRVPDHNAGVWAVSPAGGDPVRLVHRRGWAEAVGPGAWSPDGRRLAYTAHQGSGNRVGVWDRASGTGKLLPDCDALTTYLAWSPDEAALLYLAATTGWPTVRPLHTRRRRELHEFPRPPGRGVRWAPFPDPLVSGQDGSLWRHGPNGWRQLVPGSVRAIAPPEEIEYPGPNGTLISAAVWKGSAGCRWVVWVRGGPGAGRDLDAPQLEALLRDGFSVLQPDYRGCGGRGQAWVEANRRDYGGRDAEDIVAAAHFLVRSGLAERRAVGVAGYSYGAFLALTALERAPEAFAAGALLWPLLELANLPALAGTDYTLAEWRDFSSSRSPLNDLHRVAMPVLVLHGERDRAATAQQIGAIRDGLETATVEIFPDDGHGLSRHTREVCQRLGAFFRRNLGGPA